MPDLLRCSRCFSGDVDLTELACVVDVCGEELEQIKKKYKTINLQALQVLKRWEGSRQVLHEILMILGLSDAAEKYVYISLGCFNITTLLFIIETKKCFHK